MLADTEGDEILVTIATEVMNDEENERLLSGLSQEFLMNDMDGSDGDSLAKSVTGDGCKQELSKDDETGNLVNDMTNREQQATVPSIQIEAEEIINNFHAEEVVTAGPTIPTRNEIVPTDDENRTDNLLPIKHDEQYIENLDDSAEEDSIDADDREIDR